MTGREIFNRYERIISVCIGVYKKTPRKFRTACFNVCRNINGKIGIAIRYIILATLVKEIGKNVSVFTGCYFRYYENLSIGDNVSIHEMSYIDAEGEIDISSNVSIAHRCSIISSNHSYLELDVPIKYQKMILEKVSIKDDVWIGCSTVILPGCTIGTGCVIGANSTVSRSIEPMKIAVGSPARIIKSRI